MAMHDQLRAESTTPTFHREVLPSASPHVALALVEIPGPAHVVEAAPYHRISFNIGPSYTADVAGDGLDAHFTMKRHALMIIPADAAFTHRAGTKPPAGRRTRPGRLATFRLSRELVADCAMALRLPPEQGTWRHQVVPADEVLRLLAQALLADLQAGHPDGAEASEHLAAALVQRLLSRQCEAARTAADWLERVRAHVEERLAGPLSLEDLAAVAGMSLFHFCRMFREHLQVTPHRYILAQRMAHARRLLWAHRERSVLEIALACGFQSPSHFAAQFKKHTGKTPLQWQRSP